MKIIPMNTYAHLIIDMVYPVGSYYWSSNVTNPSSIFGGTWEQIKDRFVLAAGDSYKVGATGGEATHKLTVSEMPSHSHSASTNWAGDHVHDMYLSPARNEAANYGLVGSGGFADRCPVQTDGASAYYMRYSGGHSHSVTVNNAGGSAAHNNMPPYIVAYCWHRTA